MITTEHPTITAMLGEHACTDPRYLFDDGAKPLAVRLNYIHRELRATAGLASLQRIAIAVYDQGNDRVKTFVESNIGGAAIGSGEAVLARMGSLRKLALVRAPRIIDEITRDAPGRLAELYRNGIRSSMTVPIYSQSQLFGFIFFDADRSDFFHGTVSDRLLPYAKLLALVLIHEIMTIRLVRAMARTAQELTRQRDYETASHLERMANYARLIAVEGAKSWGLTDEFVEHLFWFAPLHDIGKVAVRDSILLKPGKLTEAEMSEMKLHVARGVEIIDAITRDFGLQTIPYMGVARNIIAFHHENVDGSGYPMGAMGNEIPIEGRIIAVADVFDALTSDRPYKRRWSNEDAIDHVRKLSGRKFDPDCVEAFIRRMDDVVEIQERFPGDIAL